MKMLEQTLIFYVQNRRGKERILSAQLSEGFPLSWVCSCDSEYLMQGCGITGNLLREAEATDFVN